MPAFPEDFEDVLGETCPDCDEERWTWEMTLLAELNAEAADFRQAEAERPAVLEPVATNDDPPW
jgi:hypothetical protein